MSLVSFLLTANEDLAVASRALYAAVWAEQLRSSEERYRFGLPLMTGGYFPPTLAQPEG